MFHDVPIYLFLKQTLVLTGVKETKNFNFIHLVSLI